MYFNEFYLKMKEKELHETVTDVLFTYAILPSIFGSFTMSKKGALNLQLGVYLLFTFYKYIENQEF